MLRNASWPRIEIHMKVLLVSVQNVVFVWMPSLTNSSGRRKNPWSIENEHNESLSKPNNDSKIFCQWSWGWGFPKNEWHGWLKSIGVKCNQKFYICRSSPERHKREYKFWVDQDYTKAFLEWEHFRTRRPFCNDILPFSFLRLDSSYPIGSHIQTGLRGTYFSVTNKTHPTGHLDFYGKCEQGNINSKSCMPAWVEKERQKPPNIPSHVEFCFQTSIFRIGFGT